MGLSESCTSMKIDGNHGTHWTLFNGAIEFENMGGSPLTVALGESRGMLLHSGNLNSAVEVRIRSTLGHKYSPKFYPHYK